MPDQPAPEIELLRAAYAAFNARDIDAALATMTPDVAWPKAFEGGSAHGQEVRAYWTKQWSEINPYVEPVSFHLEDARRILVGVHQVVRDLAGTVLADEHVGHRYTHNFKPQICSSSVRSRHLTRRCSERGGVVSVAERLLAELPAVGPCSMSFTTTFMLDKSAPEIELPRGVRCL